MTYRTELEKRLKLLDLQTPPNTNSDEILLNRAKVGTAPSAKALPPSKITRGSVIYLNSYRAHNERADQKTGTNKSKKNKILMKFTLSLGGII